MVRDTSIAALQASSAKAVKVGVWAGARNTAIPVSNTGL